MNSARDAKLAFGKALKACRTRAGISQEKLADLAGIHRTYMGDVERGERNISLVNLLRVADALEVRLSTLIRKMENHLDG